MTPLKPSSSRKRSKFKSGLSDAGSVARAHFRPRLSPYAGKVTCPAMIDFTPASMTAEKTRPYVARHSSIGRPFRLVTKCWSRSSWPSPGKCLVPAMNGTDCIARVARAAISAASTGSEVNARVLTTGLRRLSARSTTGVNDQLKPR